jgi:SAM-dependent methyltransferase
MVWGSKTFGNSRQMFETMIERYSSDQEMNYYLPWAAGGLVPCETTSVTGALSIHPKAKTALVVGCGTGREVFALEKYGLKVLGIDVCERMINEAKKLASSRGSLSRFQRVDLLNDDFFEKFDFILVSGSLGNHIHGRANRVFFWKQIANALKIDGLMVHGPEIKIIKRFSRFYFASLILRLRWLGQDRWEKGDTALSFLGNHNVTDELIFFHYYQSKSEFTDELSNAGLKALAEVSPPMWIFAHETEQNVSTPADSRTPARKTRERSTHPE